MRETHQSIASCMCPNWRSNPQPRYVPQWTLKPSVYREALQPIESQQLGLVLFLIIKSWSKNLQGSCSSPYSIEQKSQIKNKCLFQGFTVGKWSVGVQTQLTRLMSHSFHCSWLLISFPTSPTYWHFPLPTDWEWVSQRGNVFTQYQTHKC